jgi:hypothetical protein
MKKLNNFISILLKLKFLIDILILIKFRSLDRNQDELFQYIQAGEFEYLMPYWEGISECLIFKITFLFSRFFLNSNR